MIRIINALHNLWAIYLFLHISEAFLIGNIDVSVAPDIIVASKAIADQAVLALDALRQASVPMTLDSALSIGISEVFAGVTAGAITRRTADLLGDKKKDTFRTKVSTTGAFFGARGLARGIARAVGLPKPLALLCGSVAGSLISEGTKIFGRTEAEQMERKLKKQTIFEDSGLKGSEIAGDIVKWLVYDGLEDKLVISPADEFLQLVLATFLVGAISAISGTMIKDFGRGIEREVYINKMKKLNEKKKKELKKEPIDKSDVTDVRMKAKSGVQSSRSSANQNTFKNINNLNSINGDSDSDSILATKTVMKDMVNKKINEKEKDNIEIDNNPFIRAVLTRYLTAAIEGGVLFASYQIMTKIVTTVVPENLNVKFVFNQVIEEIEREIDPDIL